MTPDTARYLTIVITAGEASGDALGARLMQDIKAQHLGPVQFSGVGGAQMEAEGLTSLFPIQDLSVMGLTEVVPRLRIILGHIREMAQFIDTQRPDIVVTIDSPDFSFRVASAVQKSAYSAALWVHYVAPTVWAWRPERAKKIAKLYGGLICLLPFEPDYFTREGMSAAFTGHPAVNSIPTLQDGEAFRKRSGIADDCMVIGALFGSRGGELKRVAPVIRAAIDLVLQRYSDRGPFCVVAPTLPHLRDRVEALLQGVACPVCVVSDPAEKWPAFAAMDAAVAVSGTVGLELALAGVPHVIAYRMNGLTYEVVRRKVKTPYAHLANILLDQMVVPELIQADCTPNTIAEALGPLLNSNGAAATAQRTAFTNIRQMLSGDRTQSPSTQAAGYILELWKARGMPAA